MNQQAISDIRRKTKVLAYADEIGNVSKASVDKVTYTNQHVYFENLIKMLFTVNQQYSISVNKVNISKLDKTDGTVRASVEFTFH